MSYTPNTACAQQTSTMNTNADHKKERLCIPWVAGMSCPEEKGLQPQPLANWSAFFYFVAFVIVVSYTLLNLYIGESLQD